MHNYWSLDYLLKSLQQPGLQKDSDNRNSSLENLLGEKVLNLAEILGQIEQDIQHRRELSLRIIHDVEEHDCHLKTKLLQLKFWELGSNPSIEARRAGLERQLDFLKKARRQEQVTCWQDVSNLKREFRTWFKQYSELVQRVKLFSPGWAHKK